MCYCVGDNLMPCADERFEGVVAVRLLGSDGQDQALIPALPAVELPAGVRLSPNALSVEAPTKYSFGEVYSGFDSTKYSEKIQQLESLVDFAVKRCQDRMGVVVADVTQVVGAVVLVFSAKPRQRPEHLDRIANRIRRCVSVPHLHRLAAAGRLLLMLLDTSQASMTFALRCLGEHAAGKLSIVAE